MNYDEHIKLTFKIPAIKTLKIIDCTSATEQKNPVILTQTF